MSAEPAGSPNSVRGTPITGTVDTVRWTGSAIEVLDQRQLPRVERTWTLETTRDVVAAIASLAVRGAPAIGVCGAFGVALAARELGEEATPAALARAAEPIAAARPTAVNLPAAVSRVLRATRGAATPDEVRRSAETEALAILAEDRAACRSIGLWGREELADAGTLLTVCNTGRLATAGWGTALGIVYAKAEAGEPVEVLACETRPLLQGARLTAWELARAGIPVTLLADGAAAAAMAAGRIDAVIVGCDRVAANGDTANKVGTYAVALAAARHGLPFYVAGPLSSFDLDTPTGREIVVEERAAEELRAASGIDDPHVGVWNPAFDVTPAELITAFVTDAGILRPPFADAIASTCAAGELAR